MISSSSASSSTLSSRRELYDPVSTTSSKTLQVINSPKSVSSNGSSNDEKFFEKTMDSPCSPESTISSIKSPDSTTSSMIINSPPPDLPKIDTNPGPSSSGIGTISLNNASVLKYQCSVCGDKASESYFGAVSCDSCGGFFKRAVKNNKTYSCISNRDCVLNKKNRNHCKSCRLQKCYKVGMKPVCKTLFLFRFVSRFYWRLLNLLIFSLVLNLFNFLTAGYLDI